MDSVGEHDSAWRPEFYCAAQQAAIQAMISSQAVNHYRYAPLDLLHS
jgi:hypothetical protein